MVAQNLNLSSNLYLFPDNGDLGLPLRCQSSLVFMVYPKRRSLGKGWIVTGSGANGEDDPGMNPLAEYVVSGTIRFQFYNLNTKTGSVLPGTVGSWEKASVYCIVPGGFTRITSGIPNGDQLLEQGVIGGFKTPPSYDASYNRNIVMLSYNFVDTTTGLYTPGTLAAPYGFTLTYDSIGPFANRPVDFSGPSVVALFDTANFDCTFNRYL